MGWRCGVGFGCRRKLLRRRVVLSLRVGRRRIVAPIGGVEEHLRIMLGGVIVLVAAVIGVGVAGRCAREGGERHFILALRRNRVGQADARAVIAVDVIAARVHAITVLLV